MLQTYSRRLLLPNPTLKHIRTLILGIESSCDDSGAAIIKYVHKNSLKVLKSRYVKSTQYKKLVPNAIF